MRLNKFLAASGIASRRKCDELIKSGQVRLNGQSGDFTGYDVDPAKDKIEYNGKRVVPVLKKRYVLLNKPSGYVSTCSDDKGRETVLDIIKDSGERLFPVGRLDFDTEGLLLLTNDGELAYRLTHPKHEIDKKYFARASGAFTPEKKDHLEKGVLLDGKRTSRSKVEILRQTEKYTDLSITIHEGRNRQVRRMLEALGLQVSYLQRTAIGRLNIKDLKTGEYRDLTEREIQYLFSL